jgi:hypothetical protein
LIDFRETLVDSDSIVYGIQNIQYSKALSRLACWPVSVSIKEQLSVSDAGVLLQ